MAYDAAKAHEYYVNYRKKGLKKGRKKGSGKKSSTKSLVGVSTAGLNSDGKIEAALVKEKVKNEMNEALKKAKTDEERDQIRREYSKRAITEIDKLKSDSKYAKPKAVKAPKAAKTSSSRSSGSKSSGSSKSSSSGSKTSTATAAIQKSMETLTTLMTGLSEKIAKMTEEQKTEAKTLISDILSEIQKQMGDKADLTSLKEQLEKKFATQTSTDVKV